MISFGNRLGIGRARRVAGSQVAPPGDLAITEITWSKATANWSGVSGASLYEWQVLSLGQEILAQGSSEDTSSGLIEGLPVGATLIFRVRTEVNDLFSSWVSTSFTTVSFPSVAPSIAQVVVREDGSVADVKVNAYAVGGFIEPISIEVQTDLAGLVGTGTGIPGDPFVIITTNGTPSGQVTQFSCRLVSGSSSTPWSPGVTATTWPEAGWLLGTYCSGYDLMGNYANGSGGVDALLIASNSESCGYTPPPPDDPAPTTPPPTTPPP